LKSSPGEKIEGSTAALCPLKKDTALNRFRLISYSSREDLALLGRHKDIKSRLTSQTR